MYPKKSCGHFRITAGKISEAGYKRVGSCNRWHLHMLYFLFFINELLMNKVRNGANLKWVL